MAITNHQRVESALGIFVKGLAPFVERELLATLGENWKDQIEGGFSGSKTAQWDTTSLIGTMLSQWNVVFSKTLGNGERSLAHEIRDFRNKWAHQQKLTYDDVYRTLDSISRLLAAVSAGDQATEIEKQKQEILRIKYDEQRRSEERKVSVTPVEGKPTTNLKPWREVIQPHPDVASGRYQQAEFAADLWQVYLREGSDEYKDPAEFFRRTFLTEGLKHLLARSVERLAGKGGDPVVELQTNFGGGKTHSMLALFHLFSGESSSRLSGVDDLLKASGMKVPSNVNRAVLVGTKISPGQVHKKSDGTKVRTLWGEIAWQIGKKQGYEMIREADETSTNPGDTLKELFNKFAPCLVLIDEWVAYARQLHEDVSLPAGTFDTQFTFAQTLTEAAKAADRTLLVVSIPASESASPQEREKISEIEVGGQRGRESLVRLKNAIGRVEASWRPASQDEGFEIVRRRLFQPMTDRESFVARDQIAKSFRDMYEQQKQEFPSECKEATYGRRIESAYPIHPELFDRLYSDWSTLEKFQRTRGVLRLMASVIHWLWEHQDHNLMIMPATVPIDDNRVQFELTRYLEDQWIPVINKDVDGPNSLPLALDRELPNLGRYSASRRVARTIYMGSAPVQRAANRGIDERQVKLGCVQPGESVATFGDAIRRLTDRATYLYEDGKRYWYSTQPTVTRLAEDRASQTKEDAIAQEIEARLKEQTKTPSDFARVHSVVSSSDIPDEREVRLVILGSEHPHTQKDPSSPALQEAKRILESRGNSPRTYKNTLIFLAPDQNRLRDLNQAVRLYLAWRSIHAERESLDLTAFQLKQAEQRLKSAADTVAVRLPEAYQWLLIPEQSDPKGPVEIKEQKISSGDSFAIAASKKLKNDGSLITSWSGINLRHELDRIPLWGDNDVKVKQLADHFATYIYLPRLKDTDVLIQAIQDGFSRLSWELETFAFAEDFDEKKNRYIGLHAREHYTVSGDTRCLVVKPEVAAAQIAAEQPSNATPTPPPGPTGPATGEGPSKSVTAPARKKIRRFYGSVKLNPTRTGLDASRVAEEVLQHLSAIEDAEVQVTLEISADLPEGVPEKTVRDVSENCRTLKFTNYEFEEE